MIIQDIVKGLLLLPSTVLCKVTMYLNVTLAFLKPVLKGKTVSAPPAVLYPVILPVESQTGSKPANLLFNAERRCGERGKMKL